MWYDTAPILVLHLPRARRSVYWRSFRDVHLVPGYDGANAAHVPLDDPRVLSLRTRANIFAQRRRNVDEDINVPGAIGCTLSHVRVLQNLAAGNISSPTIVFEDDADVPLPQLPPGRTASLRAYLRTFLAARDVQTPTPGRDCDLLLLGSQRVHTDDATCWLENWSAWDNVRNHATQKLWPSSHNYNQRTAPTVKAFIGTHALVYTKEFALKILPWILPTEGHLDGMYGLAGQTRLIRIKHQPNMRIRQRTGPGFIEHDIPTVRLLKGVSALLLVVLLALLISMHIYFNTSYGGTSPSRRAARATTADVLRVGLASRRDRYGY